MNRNVAFDRIAGRYEQTRGGSVRGGLLVDAFAEHLDPGSRVLEIGVGTGAVAGPLRANGHQLTGIDLSRPMLERAAADVGLLVEGDAARLPFAPGRFDAVVASWAVHVIGDHEALRAEVARVLAPAGRLIVVGPRAEVEPNDMTDLAFRWGKELEVGDRTDDFMVGARARGWREVAARLSATDEAEDTPSARAGKIERRDWSSLWDLDDQQWSAHVQPVIDELRALPDPDRPRPLRMRYPVWVLTAPR